MLDTTLTPRIPNPVYTVKGALEAIHALGAAIGKIGLDPMLIELLNQRASQINGCSVCLEGHGRILRKGGESDARLDSLAGWRDSPHFSAAERTALALTEAMTRMADAPHAVSDEIWDAAAQHFSPEELAGLVLSIAGINLFNRINVATGQVGGSWQP